MDTEFMHERDKVRDHYREAKEVWDIYAKEALEIYETALRALQEKCGHESVVGYEHLHDGPKCICLLCGLEEEKDGDPFFNYNKLSSPVVLITAATAEEFDKYRVLGDLTIAWVPKK